MRIAFFTDTFLPQLNGVVTSITSLAKKLADRGHKVFIVAPRFPGREQFSYRNITVFRCMSIPAPFYEDSKFTLPFNPFMFKFIIDNNIEIVHFHTPASLGMQAVLIAKLLGLPLIGTFHTFFADPHYLKHVKLNHKAVEKIAWSLSNLFYNRCDLVVCPSEGTKSELFARKCSAPIKIIPHGIDFGTFDNSKAKEIKNRYNQKGKLLLFVGRVAHEKRLPYLLECFAIALKKVPSAKLLVVGGGPQLKVVKAKAKSLNLARSVVFTGMIEHSKLVKSGIFGACDLFVTASTTETGPISLLEAQVNGLVAVIVKGRGMELVKNGVNGYVVDPNNRIAFADAVVKLLTDAKKYNSMRKATSRAIKKYDIEKIVKKWESAYISLNTGKVSLYSFRK